MQRLNAVWVEDGGWGEVIKNNNNDKVIQHETANQLADSTKDIHKKKKVCVVSPGGKSEKTFCGECFLEKEI